MARHGRTEGETQQDPTSGPFRGGWRSPWGTWATCLGKSDPAPGGMVGVTVHCQCPPAFSSTPVCFIKGHEDPFCSRRVETRALGRSVSWAKMCGQRGRSDPALHGPQAVSQPLLRVSGAPQGGRESLALKWGSFGKIGVVREQAFAQEVF